MKYRWYEHIGYWRFALATVISVAVIALAIYRSN